MLSVIHAECRLCLVLQITLHNECRCAECRYAECRNAEYGYAERRYAECCFAECRDRNLSIQQCILDTNAGKQLS